MRGAGAMLALAGHLLLALGVPLPAPSAKTISQPFPCQDRPCGCFDAAECWKGDCCCFTLEQKLEWAEERGIEPPAHVRPLVKARKTEAPPPCPECEKARHAERAETDSLPVQWMVGAFVQKCRGQGPAGLPACEPATPPTARLTPCVPAPGDVLPDAAGQAVSRRSPPLSPPPRA